MLFNNAGDLPDYINTYAGSMIAPTINIWRPFNVGWGGHIMPLDFIHMDWEPYLWYTIYSFAWYMSDVEAYTVASHQHALVS